MRKTAGNMGLLAAVKTIKAAILKSRYMAARLANAEQLKLYFRIGGFVSRNSRKGRWGSGAIDEISDRLQQELPGLRGFGSRSLKNMRQFFETWASSLNRQLSIADLTTQAARQSPIAEMAVPAIRQLPIGESDGMDVESFFAIGFTHHIRIFNSCKSSDERWYYIHRCAAEFWSVEALCDHIRADDFRRYGKLPNNFVRTIPDERQSARAVNAFKDEYLLDYVNIDDADDAWEVDERVLQSALLQEVRKFIQSLGPDFCFVGNEYRLVVEEREFFVDLLFYHRGLRSLIAIELKCGEFKPIYLGQLNFYLSALDDKVRHADENKSIGLILCRKANRAIVELAIRDFKKPMGVATYRTGATLPEDYQQLVPLMNGVKAILQNPASIVANKKTEAGR